MLYGANLILLARTDYYWI